MKRRFTAEIAEDAEDGEEEEEEEYLSTEGTEDTEAAAEEEEEEEEARMSSALACHLARHRKKAFGTSSQKNNAPSAISTWRYSMTCQMASHCPSAVFPLSSSVLSVPSVDNSSFRCSLCPPRSLRSNASVKKKTPS